MRKIIIIGLTLLLIVSSSLAAYTYPEFFRENMTFAPTSTRIEGMGGAGVSTSTGLDSLYMNPANLANGRFSLYLPAVTVTAFNAKNIVDSGMIQEIMDGNVGVSTGTKYLNTISVDKGDLLTTDISFGFAGGGFGLALNVQEQLHNIDKGVDTNLILEVNAAAAIGLGINLNFIPNILSVDVGATVRPTYKAFTNKIGAQGIISDVFGEEDDDFLQTFLASNRLAAGYAIPIDVGVNVNLPVGLSVSGVMRNINGSYTMKDYSEAGLWVNEMLELVSQETIYEDEAPIGTISGETTITVPYTIDIGFGWAPNLGSFSSILRPSIAIDLVDVANLPQEMEDNEQAIWNHLRAGAEVKLLSAIDIRAGINKGYMSVGAGFDLLVIHVDAAYYWRETGINIGDKPIDALSVRFNLGIDG